MFRILKWTLMAALWPLAAAQDNCPGGSAELQTVADRHLREGRFAQAEQVTRHCLARWTKTLPAGHPERVAADSYLGLTLLLQGREQEAEALLQESYRQAQANGAPEALAAAASYLGTFYRYQQDSARALPLLRLAHRKTVELRGVDAAMAGSTLMEIGAVLAGDGKFALAEKNFLESRRILEKHRLPAEMRIADIYIAVMQFEQGRQEEAEPVLQRAIRAESDGSAMADTTRAMALYHLARLSRAQKREAETDRYYREAISAYARAALPPFPHVSEVAAEYAQFLKHRRRPEAKAWAARAKAWREK